MTRSGAGIDLVVGSLSCPTCGLGLSRTGSTLICDRHHSFDIARQGYVSLFGGGRRANTGDDATMVAARERFLSRGHYAPIADAIVDAATDILARSTTAPRSGNRLIADLAGGTGYYLARLLDAAPDLVGVSLDLSTAASRRAARVGTEIAAIAADVWQRLPLLDGSCAMVLSVFGPRNGPEILRVLAPDGALVVVSPSPRHLRELIGPLGLIDIDPRKQDRLQERLAGLDCLSSTPVDYRATLSRADIADEVAMGPSSHHVDPVELSDRAEAMQEHTAVTVSVEVSVWVRPDGS